MGERMKAPDGKPDDLIRSPDKHFRPADPQIGPDGALWFGDWANALIGHMQYSQRDPNRDHVHGRIYRLVATDKTAAQAGDAARQDRGGNLRAVPRVRVADPLPRPPRTARPPGDRSAAGRRHVGGSARRTTDPMYDRLLCEALWVQQGHHAVDVKLADAVLACKTLAGPGGGGSHPGRRTRPHAGGVLERFKTAAADAHPRVPHRGRPGAQLLPDRRRHDRRRRHRRSCRWTTGASTRSRPPLAANEAAWPADFLTGKLAAANPEARQAADGHPEDKQAAGGMAAPYLQDAARHRAD